MARRITITIPDDLYDRLQAVKGKINVSKASRLVGIMNAVELEEIKNAALSDKEKHIAGLRLQRIECLRAAGKKYGIRDAAIMDYDDLISIAAVYDNLHSAGGESFSAYDELDGIDVMGWLKDDLHDRERKFGQFDRDVYLRGWVDGVWAYWSAIKDGL